MIRRTKVTVLFVGEGKTEVAFIKHLKKLYQPERNPPVRVDTQDGRDSGRVLRTAMKHAEGRDIVVCLYDLDKELPQEDLSRIKPKKKFKLVGAEPCIEGFMLDILGKNKKHKSSECKNMMHLLLSGKATSRDSYKHAFPKDLLEKRRKQQPKLDLILKLIEKGKV